MYCHKDIHTLYFPTYGGVWLFQKIGSRIDAPISEEFRRGGLGFTLSTYLSTYITRASMASVAMFSSVLDCFQLISHLSGTFGHASTYLFGQRLYISSHNLTYRNFKLFKALITLRILRYSSSSCITRS